MQKKILFISIFALILTTGCTRIDNNNNYIDLVVNCLDSKATTNDVALGYKYYLPKGVKLLKKYDYNQEFLVDNSHIYLYVDINSYYYKSKLKYDSENSFYFKKVNYDSKLGYIKIVQQKDNYLTKIVYNYAKIEFYSDKKDLNRLIAYSSIILNSIKYNDNTIQKILNESLGEYSDISYELEKPEDASSNFSQYLEEYVTEETEENNLPDE